MGIVKTVLEKITEMRLQITAQKDTVKPQTIAKFQNGRVFGCI